MYDLLECAMRAQTKHPVHSQSAIQGHTHGTIAKLKGSRLAPAALLHRPYVVISCAEEMGVNGRLRCLEALDHSLD